MSKIVIVVDPNVNHSLLYKVMVDVVGFTQEEIVEVAIGPNLDDRVYINKSDAIFPIGEKALFELTGKRGIMKYSGELLQSGDIPIVPILSPGYVEKNTHQLKRFAEDIHTGYQASLGLTKVKPSNQFKVIRTLKEVRELVNYIKEVGYCSFDFETTKLTDMGTFDPDFYTTMLSISFQMGSAYVIPLYHQDADTDKNVIQAIAELLSKEVFGNPDITKVGQNIKFDMHCAAWLGVTDFRGPFHDTMLMHHLIYEDTSHKLKDMVREYFPRFANYESELKGPWDAIPLDDLAKYNALDSDLTLRLYWLFTDMLLTDDERVYNLFRNLTAPAVITLFHMEWRGMRIDKEFLLTAIHKVGSAIEEVENVMKKHPGVVRYNKYLKEKALQDAIEKAEEKLMKERAKRYKSKQATENQEFRIKEMEKFLQAAKTGVISIEHPGVNFASPQQLADPLYSDHGFKFDLPLDPRTGQVVRSTNKEVLGLLKDKSGFVDDLLALRQLRKTKSTYLESTLEKLDDDHNVHGTFNVNGTKTGRLSSKNPNLQNIISRTKYKKVKEAVAYVKKCFIPPKGFNIAQVDYSQAELRIIAHYAGEKNMLKVYNNDGDLHELTAAIDRSFTLDEFKQLPTDKYKQYRFEAKASNFGLIYGMSAMGFQEYARVQYDIKMSLRKAEQKRDIFFKHYPGLPKYHKTYIAKARKYKYVRTFFGRKVHLPEIDSYSGIKKGHAERNAINSPIQGTAGEFTIFALCLLHHKLDPKYAMLVNSIHDSLMAYIMESENNVILDYNLGLIKETMENLPTMEYFGKEIDTVKMKVDAEVSSDSWGQLEEYAIRQ